MLGSPQLPQKQWEVQSVGVPCILFAASASQLYFFCSSLLLSTFPLLHGASPGFSLTCFSEIMDEIRGETEK